MTDEAARCNRIGRRFQPADPRSLRAHAAPAADGLLVREAPHMALWSLPVQAVLSARNYKEAR